MARPRDDSILRGEVDNKDTYARGRGSLFANYFQGYVREKYGIQLTNLQAGIFAGGQPYQETRGDPTQITGSHHGLMQWSSKINDGRFRKLKAHAAALGKGWQDWKTQLSFAADELFGKAGSPLERLAGRMLLKANTPYEAQRASRQFLRYGRGEGHERNRMGVGLMVAELLGRGTGTHATADGKTTRGPNPVA